MKRLLVATGVALALVGGAPTPALGVDSVTLTASATTLAYGESVELSGQTSPPTGGQTIDIVDAAGTILAQTTTGAAGGFSATLTPEASVTVHAVWHPATSSEVSIGVQAILTVRVGAVRLFDRAAVRGTVRPAHPGGTVQVTLTRDGKAVATRRPTTGAAGGFDAVFRIEKPGTYRVRAAFVDDDHLKGTAIDGPRSTSLPSLGIGSSGIYVDLLERRLVDLNYRLTGVDGRYDFRTGDAVLAFRKVQRMPRVFGVDAGVWRVLADPIRPRPKSSADGFHIEIDQTRQVVYTVDDGTITNIMHVSTGKASTPTRDGWFRVNRKLAGFSPNRLYYPSYFDGNRAIHGWTEVPTYPASHGCVRVPYWNAQWIFGLAEYGTRVIVYH